MGRLVVAVASGKGGTGKTTVATNLARTAAGMGRRVTYLDCDVEEPNGRIFLKPVMAETSGVCVPTPKVDETKCSACGKCGEVCRYSAIALLGRTVLTFPNLCHGCGGCMLFCPSGAIAEAPRGIGCVEAGSAAGVDFVQGRLRVGEAMSPPLIRKVKDRIPSEGLAVIDCPPGTSCPVIQAVKGADYVLLVTEPTPFGLHDLRLAVETLRALRLPFGVVVNRADVGDRKVFEYCRSEGIDILLEIRDDRRIAEAYSRGVMAVDAVAELDDAFRGLIGALIERTHGTEDMHAPDRR